MTAAATATTAMSEAARIIAAPYRDGSRIGLLWIRHPGLRQCSGMTPESFPYRRTFQARELRVWLAQPHESPCAGEAEPDTRDRKAPTPRPSEPDRSDQ